MVYTKPSFNILFRKVLILNSGDIGSNRFQLFLVDTGTVSTGKAGNQRLVPVKSPKENQSPD